jgi:hypothetical protein
MTDEDLAQGRFAAAYSVVTRAPRAAKRKILNANRKTTDFISGAFSKMVENFNWHQLADYISFAVGAILIVALVISSLVLMMFFATVLYMVWPPLGYVWALFTVVGLLTWVMAIFDSLKMKKEMEQNVEVMFENFSSAMKQASGLVDGGLI